MLKKQKQEVLKRLEKIFESLKDIEKENYRLKGLMSLQISNFDNLLLKMSVDFKEPLASDDYLILDTFFEGYSNISENFEGNDLSFIDLGEELEKYIENLKKELEQWKILKLKI